MNASYSKTLSRNQQKGCVRITKYQHDFILHCLLYRSSSQEYCTWCILIYINTCISIHRVHMRRGIFFVIRKCICSVIILVVRHLQKHKGPVKHRTCKTNCAENSQLTPQCAPGDAKNLAPGHKLLQMEVAGRREPALACSFVTFWPAKANSIGVYYNDYPTH